MGLHRNPTRLGATFLVLLGLSGVAAAQGDRAGTWEAGFSLADLSGETLTGQRPGVSLDVSDDISWGGTMNYNLTDRLALGGDFWFSSPDYQATRVLDNAGQTTQSISSELDIWTIQLKGTFNFIDGPFTPFVEVGAGWTEIDSNIPDGPPTTGCWWDPWWGYVCTSFYDTYSETRTSMIYGAGLRWEMGNGVILKGSYSLLDVETNQASEDAELDVIRLDLLWSF
jgi:opacity protein-like surface antigen